jgi:hypothetical protein
MAGSADRAEYDELNDNGQKSVVPRGKRCARVCGLGRLPEGSFAMPNRMQETGKGQQPETLRSLKSAARAGSKKPREQGLEAQSDTAPIPAPPEQEQAAAAEILKAGTEKNPKAMEAAAKKAPRR